MTRLLCAILMIAAVPLAILLLTPARVVISGDDIAATAPSGPRQRARCSGWDDTAALQAAIDAAGNGGTGALPPSTCGVSSPLIISPSHIDLSGPGNGATIFSNRFTP